jgi:hypothetical protein
VDTALVVFVSELRRLFVSGRCVDSVHSRSWHSIRRCQISAMVDIDCQWILLVGSLQSTDESKKEIERGMLIVPSRSCA